MYTLTYVHEYVVEINIYLLTCQQNALILLIKNIT